MNTSSVRCRAKPIVRGNAMRRTIWINAGELSGDMQAASLLHALKARQPDLQAVGMGGPHLAAAGQHTLFRVESLSVMGFSEVLSAVPRALRLLRGIGQELEQRRPEAVVLVDAPEFNFQVAKKAHRLGIPVYYFIPPKVWAWRTGRVEFLRRHIRELLCILPFEEAFYRAHGLSVHYVGNPLVDMVNWPSIRHIEPDPLRIGLMPGSRNKEVRALMPLFGDMARHLLFQRPDLRFHCLRAPNMTEAHLRSFWPADIPLAMESPEGRYEAMRRCRCVVAASGTATLETALAGVPTVVTYKVSPLSAFFAKRFIRVPFVSLPNLILDRELFPELLQDAATPETLSSAVTRWLDDAAALAEVHSGLETLRDRCGDAGSADRAAAVLLHSLDAVSAAHDSLSGGRA